MPPNDSLSGPQAPPTSTGSTRPLAGSIASNRKRIAGRESTSGGGNRQSVQSPLEGSLAPLGAAELREQFKGKEELVQAIEAKLTQWEATTVATLQEIRDLKDLFAQMK
jgi:hypothetical protein